MREHVDLKMGGTHLDKAGHVYLTIIASLKVLKNETLFGRELQIVDATLQEFVAGNLCSPGFRNSRLVD